MKDSKLIDPPADISVHGLSLIHMSLGYKFTCGIFHKSMELNSKNGILCWGTNELNQLDVPHDLYSNASNIATGLSHACALNELKESICWGSNNKNQTKIPLHMKTDLVKVAAG